jgi:hypothetical protein
VNVVFYDKGAHVNITIKDGHNRENVGNVIFVALSKSRFTFELEHVSQKRLKIVKVRLRSSKAYCGNHPGACQRGGKDRKGRFLEGADWVEFNDMLNDVLDKLKVDARVESSVVLVRRGRERCVEYFQQQGRGRNAEWEKTGLYADYCGQEAPPSDFPEGTPGIYERIGYNVVG